MKNTSRIRRNNNANPSEKQGEKPAIPGQSAATIGHKQFATKGKVTLGALHVGEAICLDENAIKLLASKAESAGLTPAGFCKLAILERLFPSVQADRAKYQVIGKDELESAIRDVKALFQLMFETLAGDNADIFHSNNGHLAAGLQSLMWRTCDGLENAFKGLH